jgi:hypothetical protein
MYEKVTNDHIMCKQIKKTKIVPDIINVGGGFPSIYPDLNPQPLQNYVDEIKKSFDNLYRNSSREKFEINISTDYKFFLIGRAKKNTFPKNLGGSLWFTNGTPSIYIENSSNIEIVSRIDSLKDLSSEFQNINSLNKIKFHEIIYSHNK